MCGILACVGDGPPAIFSDALNRLAHRGPDGEGIWRDQGITLGHRRLAIIDLSENAAQPMGKYDRYYITYNGEIYNYLELGKELEQKGYRFTTKSDTEVLLYAYMHWGSDCLLKLNGMWAFAVWDNRERTLFLARDRLGKKPLFYYRSDRFFVVSSEMKGIYPFIGDIRINYDLCRKAYENVFCYESTEECLINDIKRFPAGSYGTYKEDALTTNSYWEPLSHIHPVPGSFDEQKEQFLDLLTDACRLRMRSDASVGSALSGGLDSSTIVSTIAGFSEKTSDYKHKIYVACFPNLALDERPYAEMVIRKYGLHATYVNIEPTAEIEHLFYYTYLFEEFYLTMPLPFVQLYRRMKTDGLKVTIDGHGADELFAGYPFELESILPHVLPNLRKWIDIHAIINNMYGSKGSYVVNAARMLKSSASARYRHRVKSKKAGNLDLLNAQLFGTIYETVLPTLLRNYDRYSMMNGVEIRMPYLDHRMLSFALSLPAEAKIGSGFGKYIVRKAFEHRLPPEVVFRKAKIGWNAPFSDWLRSSLKTWLYDEIHSKAFEESSLINGKLARNEITALLKRNKAKINFHTGQEIWKKIMPYVWERSLQYAGTKRPSTPVI